MFKFDYFFLALGLLASVQGIAGASSNDESIQDSGVTQDAVSMFAETIQRNKNNPDIGSFLAQRTDEERTYLNKLSLKKWHGSWPNIQANGTRLKLSDGNGTTTVDFAKISNGFISIDGLDLKIRSGQSVSQLIDQVEHSMDHRSTSFLQTLLVTPANALGIVPVVLIVGGVLYVADEVGSYYRTGKFIKEIQLKLVACKQDNQARVANEDVKKLAVTLTKYVQEFNELASDNHSDVCPLDPKKRARFENGWHVKGALLEPVAVVERRRAICKVQDQLRACEQAQVGGVVKMATTIGHKVLVNDGGALSEGSLTDKSGRYKGGIFITPTAGAAK